ncbi:hypothetical protein TNCT_421271 [Trichonephila clavata]|uniref:Uncharacterized protein n=1 Tax=Trichonephila clavata TaxID=2740835 RepID=A0A8X6G4Q5_TRICU|nr:hypothetical protein TNCT_421271 [Trichonephila clavata]
MGWRLASGELNIQKRQAWLGTLSPEKGPWNRTPQHIVNPPQKRVIGIQPPSPVEKNEVIEDISVKHKN